MTSQECPRNFSIKHQKDEPKQEKIGQASSLSRFLLGLPQTGGSEYKYLEPPDPDL